MLFGTSSRSRANRWHCMSRKSFSATESSAPLRSRLGIGYSVVPTSMSHMPIASEHAWSSNCRFYTADFSVDKTMQERILTLLDWHPLVLHTEGDHV